MDAQSLKTMAMLVFSILALVLSCGASPIIPMISELEASFTTTERYDITESEGSGQVRGERSLAEGLTDEGSGVEPEMCREPTKIELITKYKEHNITPKGVLIYAKESVISVGSPYIEPKPERKKCDDSDSGERLKCPSQSYTDRNNERFPRELPAKVCDMNCMCADGEGTCQEVTYDVPVLFRTKKCAGGIYEYEAAFQKIVVDCVCKA